MVSSSVKAVAGAAGTLLPSPFAFLTILVVTAALLSLLPLQADAYTPFTKFTNFQFAPNGVCVQPNLFVTLVDKDDDDKKRIFTMRNVPGEGDCMFLAVALATLTSMGLGGNDALLRAVSRETRAVVASVFEKGSGNLVIEGKRLVTAQSLLKSAAQSEGVSTDQYLDLLRKEGIDGGLYGGGPELAVLANVLRRPISIYELAEGDNNNEEANDSNSNSEIQQQQQPIYCAGTFGESTFADPLTSIPESAILSNTLPTGAYSWHLHILVVDVSPIEKHACVLLPQ